MVDVETVTALLAALGQYVDELEKYRVLSYAEFAATTQHYWAVEHGLQRSTTISRTTWTTFGSLLAM